MALVPIQPVAQPVLEKKGKKGGFGGLLTAIGGAAGGVAGGLAGGPQGALQGAAAGASLGGTAGQIADPGTQGSITQAPASPTIQVSAAQEAQRGQQILEGLRVAQNEQALGSYASPLTEAYIQSMTNLQKRG